MKILPVRSNVYLGSRSKERQTDTTTVRFAFAVLEYGCQPPLVFYVCET